jgi:hypothetical protein
MPYKFSSRPCVSGDILDRSVIGGSEFVSSRRAKNFSSFIFANSNLSGVPERRAGEFRVLELHGVVQFRGGICCNADRFNEDFQGQYRSYFPTAKILFYMSFTAVWTVLKRTWMKRILLFIRNILQHFKTFNLTSTVSE